MTQNIDLAERVLARLRGMETVRRPWMSLWRELTEYVLPRKVSGGTREAGTTPGQAGDGRIFDSTPPHALELLASALGSLLTDSALPWFELKALPGTADEDGDLACFLEECRERMLSVFNSEDTGFQAHVHELYLDVALLGTAVMYVEADREAVVRFSTRPLGEVFVAESVRGRVDTVFRRYELTVRQAWQEWGEACSEQVRSRLENNPEEKVEILHAVFPRADRDPLGLGCANFPWASVYMEAGSRILLEESGYLEFPYMVPRWSKGAGEIYGRGPGLTALSDTRVLNAMSRTALMAAEKMADPPLMVPDDGFLGPVHTSPGGLSYYRAGSQDRIEPLAVNVDLGSVEKMMQSRRDSVRRIFLNEQLEPAGGQAVSATEALIRQAEKMRVLGPVLGRMQAEFLGPLVRRVFKIMLRAGALPPFPRGVDPERVRIECVSPLARARRQQEAQSLSRTMEYLAPLVGQSDPYMLLDNFQMDRVARHSAELFGAPADYLRSTEEVEALRLKRLQALPAEQVRGGAA